MFYQLKEKQKYLAAYEVFRGFWIPARSDTDLINEALNKQIKQYDYKQKYCHQKAKRKYLKM